MSVKLAAKLPDGEANGLVRILRALTQAPGDSHVVVAVVDCSRITTDIDTGDVIPTARILEIEPLSERDADAALEMLRRAFVRRTGQQMLGLAVDPETGEIR